MTKREANEMLINKHDYYFNNAESPLVTRYAAVVKQSNDNSIKNDYYVEIAYTNGEIRIDMDKLIISKSNIRNYQDLMRKNLVNESILDDVNTNKSQVIFTEPFYYQNNKAICNSEYPNENPYKKSNRFYKKLTGGVSVYNRVVDDEGTAGAFFKTKKDNTIYLLSNYHVLRANPQNTEYRIYHKGKKKSKKVNRKHIGDIVWEKPIDKKYINTIDAAVAKVNSKTCVDIGRYTRCYNIKLLGVDKPKIGQNVKKCGRTTGITFGEIRSINCTINISENENELNIYRNQILTTLMTNDGDSGSVLINDDNKVVGLLFAGNNYSCSVANPIKTIFREIKNDIKDFKFKKFV